MLLPCGATLILFTDGFVRSRSASLADALSRLASVATSGPADAGELCDRILDACVRPARQDDDASVLVLRR